MAATRDEIPGDAFPDLWTNAQPDMLTAYGHLCAFVSLYIAYGTGAPSIDHMLLKSRRWDRVYEWSNYRLACDLVNSRKGASMDVLDPFSVGDDWFALELTFFQVKRGPGAPADGQVSRTLDLLNHPRFCAERGVYFERYQQGKYSFSLIEECAPFLARELRRQGRLLPADQSP